MRKPSSQLIARVFMIFYLLVLVAGSLART